MYIGIADDGQVLGLDNVHKWQEDIPNKIVQNLGIVCEINTQEEFGKTYLEINVQPSNVPIVTSGTTSHPYNLTSTGSNSLKNNGNDLTTLQANNLTSLIGQITDFCAQWRTLGEIAEHVQRSRQYLRGEVIPQMLDVLERKYDSPTHPKQQYRTKR